jgi:hypothetical protein
MSELRAKMIRAMDLKNLSPHTQRAYLTAVTGFAKFYNQSPDKMTKEKIEGPTAATVFLPDFAFSTNT